MHLSELNLIRRQLPQYKSARGKPARGKPTRGKQSSRGFTLLETIVALVIFSGTAMAFADLLNVNLNTLGRVQEVSAQIPAVKNAVAHLRAMNLKSQQDGEFEQNGHGVVWQAKLLQPHKDSQTRTGYQGYHRVGLYQIDFQMLKDGLVIGEYQLRVAGFETVRVPSF
jgi:general secretion pathway protein I